VLQRLRRKPDLTPRSSALLPARCNPEGDCPSWPAARLTVHEERRISAGQPQPTAAHRTITTARRPDYIHLSALVRSPSTQFMACPSCQLGRGPPKRGHVLPCKLVEETPQELPWIESGSLVRDFWSAVEYGSIPEFLGRLKARGHRQMAKWGQNILLGKNGKQKDLSSLSSWMQWQWQWSLKLCQRRQPQTSATGNVISWNLGPLGIHAAQPYIAQAMRKKAAIVMLQEIQIPQGSKFRVQRDFRWKYSGYECYIAAGSDIDLVADMDGDQVPSVGYNDGRALSQKSPFCTNMCFID